MEGDGCIASIPGDEPWRPSPRPTCRPTYHAFCSIVLLRRIMLPTDESIHRPERCNRTLRTILERETGVCAFCMASAVVREDPSPFATQGDWDAALAAVSRARPE